MPTYKKTILLTGAGFSKNFGGFLGREMWAKIFNNPKLNTVPTIKEELRSNFDFEEVLSNVLKNHALSSMQKETFQEVVIDAYDDMDHMLGQYVSTSDDPCQVNFNGVREFLGLFAGSNGIDEVGLHFTLNQDLFLERKVSRPAFGLELLQYKKYIQEIDSGKIDSKFRVNLPDDEFIGKFKNKHINSVGDLFYIKLHGSSGWFSATGLRQMILAKNKLEDIMKEPLLKWYLEIFEEALYRNDVRLFIVGYGFGDQHINERLVKAITEYGLKIYVVSPSDPESFKNRLIGKPKNESSLWAPKKDGITTWAAIEGLFPYEFKDIFPSDQCETDKKKDLFNAIIG